MQIKARRKGEPDHRPTMQREREIDVRWLQPPEPFERIVDELSRLGRGERLRVLIHREPLPLFDMLGENGYAFESGQRSDGMFEIVIWEPER